MDKRTIAAMALIALIVILWPFYMEWVSPPVQKGISPKPAYAPDSLAANARKDTIIVKEKTKLSTTEERIFEETPFSVNAPERTILIRSSLYTARITNRGGGNIRQWSLNKFRDHAGQPIDFVDPSKNLDLTFSYHNKKIRLRDAVFECSFADSVVDLSQLLTASVTYRLVFDQSRSIVHTMTFHEGSYHFDYTTEFTGFGDEINNGEYFIEWTGGLRNTEKDIQQEANYFKAYALLGDEKQEFDIGDQSTEEVSYTGITKWVATRTKYFVAYIIPGDKDGSSVRFVGSSKLENGTVVYKDHRMALGMKFENGRRDSCKIYLGPIEFATLNSYNENLSLILEWGWAIIRPLTKGILYTLNFLYGLIPNYGWVIILFTFIVKMVLYPLTHKSYVGMQKMKEVMPRQKEIQKKYKGDSAKMQQEMMKLYKEIGYNPVSGCLPMLIQIPLLFPIYQVFNETIDMRQAPFFAWIKDLSHPDTVYTLQTGLPFIGDFNINPLPIIMTVMTFVQQKLTPMTPMGNDSDPAQKFNQKFMMYGMPIMFFFLFNNFPSGLVLYWTVFNFLTVIQQYLMSKHLIK